LSTENTGTPFVNKIFLSGEIATEYVFSHDVFGEGFYSFELLVPRLSDAHDLLPIIISERIMEGSRFAPGENINILGQIRSYNNYIEAEGRNRLVLTVFAKDYDFEMDTEPINPNDVYLDGYVCKPPIYRTTPFGREICDILIAVNRSYNKSDYIPCITWGRNARYGDRLDVGENVKIWGRMQSRIYQKKQSDGSISDRTAYEVSVGRILRT